MSSGGSAQPNFYLWGAWKSRTIKEPFLTKKVAGPLKKVLLGDSFIVALTEKGRVVSWGSDPRNGCLGLGYETHSGQARVNSDAPMEVEGLMNVADIQIGTNHVVALTQIGEVYCWGNGSKGQLGNGKKALPGATEDIVEFKPIQVQTISGEQIMQIAVVRSSTFALSTSGVVYAWGDNKDNTLGLEDSLVETVERPTKLSLLGDMRVRRLEVFENRTIIAHVRAPESEEGFGYFEESGALDRDESEVEIFKGIKEMGKAMEKTQEWWNHLLSIKHGQPYEMPHDDAAVGVDGGDDRSRRSTSKDNADKDDASQSNTTLSIQDDLRVDPGDLHRAGRHLDALVSAAVSELKRTRNIPGTRNVRFILCMFIDECRLRREKVQRTIGVRQLVDVKRKTREISAYSVTDFGANANEEIRKIIAVTKELQQMLDSVKTIQTVDVMSHELKITLIECLECKLQLHDTRVELLKAAEVKPSDPMLPALRIIKDRWNTLKQFSLYSLYLECEAQQKDFGGNDDAQLRYLVRSSNSRIDQMLQIDKDGIISHDTLVPALCYDLLRENAELRKLTNSYQLHVLMLYQGKNISGSSVGMEGIEDAPQHPPHDMSRQLSEL